MYAGSEWWKQVCDENIHARGKTVVREVDVCRELLDDALTSLLVLI